MTPEQIKETTDRLAAILEQLARLPSADRQTIIDGALTDSTYSCGAGYRDDIALVSLSVAELGMSAAYDDQLGLSEFYLGEADFKNSDLSPAKCRQWAADHKRAADAYSALQLSIIKGRQQLAKRLAKLDL
jgi:hypothetical protein